MKTLLATAMLLVGFQLTFGQSCPPTTNLSGYELPVVQLGNQCFVLLNNGALLNEVLQSAIGIPQDLGDFGNLISDVRSKLVSGSIANYQYNYSNTSCIPHEQISFNFDLSLFLEADALLGGITSNLHITGSISFERDYSVQIIENNGTSSTVLDVSSTNILHKEYHASASNSLLDLIIDALGSSVGDMIILPFVTQETSGATKSIVKLSDQVVTIPGEITGQTTICANPITLSVPAGYKSYRWSDGTTGNTLVVALPGLYSVTISDNFCNEKKLSVNVGQAAGVSDFINTELLCSGKVKLNAPGFASVKWSTGAETSSIEVSTSGIFTAEATSQAGCKGTDRVQLTFNPSCQPGAGTVAALSVATMCSEFPNLLRRWKITNPNAAAIRMDWEIAGTIEKTWIDVPPGESYLSTIAVPLNQNLLKIYWHNEKGQIKSQQQTSTATRCPKNSSSSSIATNGKFETELKVFPNPAKDRFMLEIASVEDQLVPIQILSSSGVVWYTGTVQLSQGQNYISNDISRFDNGAYVIKLGSETIRFLKQ